MIYDGSHWVVLIRRFCPICGDDFYVRLPRMFCAGCQERCCGQR